MLKIYKTSLHSAIDYAAEELKKYLRMMLLCGDIPIRYEPAATDGFRLGLMQDFGLDTSDVEDAALDDILYMDTDAEGGIIAGDNPRSVLLAVYEYLRQLGCRWLFPGVDGEIIPTVKELAPTKLRHVPTCRFRGQCNEGAEYQQNMLEAIEFTPKVGMNIFMQEFLVPGYYKHYYNHMMNEENRPPEPITVETRRQWKIQCEAEIAKRDLQYHDMGHGWSVDAIGIPSYRRDDEAYVPEDAYQYLAEVNGVRDLWKQKPTFTQVCMSNEVLRKKIVDYTADYAESHGHVHYLHFWLGDAMNAHCECANCRVKTPSDWYMILLNELDAELTKRKLDTKIVFIAYTDTLWAPVEERLKCNDRFTLLFAPISRKYTEPLTGEIGDAKVVPYVLNASTMPKSPELTFAYFEEWKKIWPGKNVAYEYHFWRQHYYDVANIRLAEVINEDVRGYKRVGIDGIIEDGSQRSFFPTGYAFYTYARTLYDNSLTTEEIAEEYFSAAFGEDWRQFFDYLKELGETFDFAYLGGHNSADIEKCKYYNPTLAEKFAKVKDVTAKGREIIKAHYNYPLRTQTASVRLLEFHADYCDMLADALIAKCQGKDDEADALFRRMRVECGKKEAYFQPCYDHFLAFYALNTVFTARTKSDEPVIY